MAGLLRDRPATPEQKARNAARHSPRAVAAVLAMLALYAYLFTQVAAPLGLPLPKQVAEWAGWVPAGVFDEDRNVDSELWLYRDTSDLANDDQRLVLFGVIAGAFLCAYFLPMRFKQASLVPWFLVAGLILYGGPAVAGLLAAHLVIYLLFHAPPPRQGLGIAIAAGTLGYWAFAADAGASPAVALIWGAVAMGLQLHGLPRLENHPRALAALRTISIQSPLIVVLLGAFAEGLDGSAWKLPLGFLLFFWQWERLMMYHIDYNAGQVPKNLPITDYLPVFLTPAVLPNWHWGVTIGQGYSYLGKNFLAEDKNKLAIEGIKIWGVALIYLVFGEWIRLSLVEAFTHFGPNVHRALTKDLVCDFVHTGQASTASVLSTTLLDQVRWFMVWAAVLHFKTGMWRVFGYRMDPYFNRPWLATNLVAFWARFTFHYREFLVRAFFYPVFFRWFREHTRLRIFVATMAAACFGNLFWGHLPEEFYYKGLRFENISSVLQTWPYFLLLGFGISFTELYLLQKKSQRKPWTRDWRILFDILAVYGTLQFYSLIHVFARPCEGGMIGDYARLFLIGFGIHL